MKESIWHRTLRRHVQDTSIAAVSRKLGYSRTTVSLVLSGQYKRGTSKFADAVRAHLKAARVSRAPLPPQLRDLDKRRHKQLRLITEVQGARFSAFLIGVHESRIWPLIRGRDKQGAADVLAKLQEPPFSAEGST